MKAYLYPLLVSSLAAQDLNQVREMVYAHQLGIQILEQREKSLQAEIRSAQAAYFPTLSAVSSYAYQSEVPALDLNLDLPSPLGNQQIHRSLGDHDRAEISLEAKYLIWEKGARQSQVQIRKWSSQIPAAELVQQKQNLDLRLALLLLQKQIPQTKIALLQSKSRAYAELIQLSQKRIHQGLEIPLAQLSLQTQMQILAAQKAKEESSLDSLNMELEELIGQPLDLSWNPAPTPMLAPYEMPTQRPEKTKLSYQAQILEAQNTALSADLWPKILGSAGWKYGNPGLNQGADTWMIYGQVGLALSWTLWDGGQKTAEKAAKAAQSKEVQSAIQLEQEQWNLRKKQIAGSFAALQKEEGALRAVQRLSDSALVLSRLSYAQGLLSLSEVIQKQNEQSDAALQIRLWEIRRQILAIGWAALHQQDLFNPPALVPKPNEVSP